MGIPSGLPTNPLVAWPLPLLRIHLLHHYLFCDKIKFCLFLLYTSTSKFKWIRIGLPHHLPLWHASNSHNHLLLFWVRYHLNRVYSQKKLRLETKYRPLLAPPSNHTLWIPLTVGPPHLYWLGTSWWCFKPYVLAPLSSIFVLFHSHAVSAVAYLLCFVLLCVSVLFLHAFPAMFFISFGLAFLSFT